MAAENEHSVPGAVKDALREMGYEHPDMVMLPTAQEWWEWYTAKAAWYDHEEIRDGRRYKMRRQTLHPARRVCREWASAILDDDGTKIGTDTDELTELLEAWATETKFVPTAQRCLERAFGVGTGALALWFDVREDEVAIRARRYDARMVLPLSWDDDGVTECAFVTEAYSDGRKVHQLQVHELGEGGTYHVLTRMFDAESGNEVFPEGILPDFDALTDLPTFAIIRPALDNIHAEGTYMGQSVFADAIDAVKGVDNAFDAMQREISVTKAKIFASESLFELQRDDDTGALRPVPMDPEDVWVVKLDTVSADEMYEVYSPAIRTQQLADALNVALAELGDLTGFGQDYFRYDKSGGMRTAKEVSASNSAFMRNIRKHENELRPQLEHLLMSLLQCQRMLNGWPVPDGCEVHVDFDDSIIQDTDSEKTMMLSEVAQGVVPKWMYLERFYAMSEEDARALVSEQEPEVLDLGA